MFSNPVGTDPIHKCLLDFVGFGVPANRAAVFVTPSASPFLISREFGFPLPIGCAHGS
jgi:hypothetical protein